MTVRFVTVANILHLQHKMICLRLNRLYLRNIAYCGIVMNVCEVGYECNERVEKDNICCDVSLVKTQIVMRTFSTLQ